MARTASPSCGQPKDTFDPEDLPDYHDDFISQEDLDAFAAALEAPTTNPVVALNDWKPIHQKIKKPRPRKKARSKDETREGFVYTLLRYPILLGVLGWIIFLFIVYNITRLYIFSYEVVAGWRGRRNNIRHELQRADSYEEWQQAAERLDAELGNEEWKRDDEYSYYNSGTVSRVTQQLSNLRQKITQENLTQGETDGASSSVGDLKALLESCIKNNFVGVENSRLYSETHIGTKYLVQRFIDEVAQSVQMVLDNQDLPAKEKTDFFRYLELNYGRTALCLSGGATFAYYHFGVIRALLDAGDLPQIITGTSGGALVAALVGTRTDEELKKLVVPALAHRIRACSEGWWTWSRRWWRTGARFDSVDWAKKSSWFCRGSMTFREAYQRTGRILNVSCVPSDPHSPTMLNNHITSPDCVIWSAVLASAAVPGILNPIVLMRKNKDGSLSPYSFGHKWKDGSLRTDIPLKQLNIHFNVTFSIVSQVNPHINLFFFSPRGLPGSPVRHRKGRGWRGGFLGSSIETSVKLDLQKYLKILRHLELLPRPMGQDWSEIWLQRFSGTVTVWPKSIISDYWNILSDPSTERLARMIRVGERSCWPRIRFIDNRLKVERVILEGLRGSIKPGSGAATPNPVQEQQKADIMRGFNEKLTSAAQQDSEDEFSAPPPPRRQSNILQELGRQAAVLWTEDSPTDAEEDGTTTTDDEGADALAHNLAVQANLKQD